ncbi:MAG TPA: hypothetical protein VJ385_14050 [Fibrobacteria bacterium]|nr:hypothetical protein [Fibrobacteria bacterium]
MKKYISHKIWSSVGFCLAAASISQAAPFMAFTYEGTDPAPDMETYIDYAATSVHGGMNTFSQILNPDASSIGARYYSFNLYSTSTTGYCLEVETGVASAQPSPDPKLWIKTGGGPFVALSDDVFGIPPVRFPAAHIWIRHSGQGSLTGFLYLAAYNSSYNDQDLHLKVKRLSTATESSCTTGQTTYPWAKLIGTTLTTGNYK